MSFVLTTITALIRHLEPDGSGVFSFFIILVFTNFAYIATHFDCSAKIAPPFCFLPNAFGLFAEGAFVSITLHGAAVRLLFPYIVFFLPAPILSHFYFSSFGLLLLS